MKIAMPQQEEARFAMAPMIDMVFLLLVFFMCASHISQSNRKPMEIPIATKAVVPQHRPDRWVVNILEDGSLFSGDQPVSIDDLAGLVQERLAENPALKVYIRADANSPHKETRKVLKELSAAGVDEFIFGVFKPSKGDGTGS